MSPEPVGSAAGSAAGGESARSTTRRVAVHAALKRNRREVASIHTSSPTTTANEAYTGLRVVNPISSVAISLSDSKPTAPNSAPRISRRHGALVPEIWEKTTRKTTASKATATASDSTHSAVPIPVTSASPSSSSTACVAWVAIPETPADKIIIVPRKASSPTSTSLLTKKLPPRGSVPQISRIDSRAAPTQPSPVISNPASPITPAVVLACAICSTGSRSASPGSTELMASTKYSRALSLTPTR